MKTNQIPDIYIEQYLLGELPENLCREIEDLILKDPEMLERINRIKQSNNDILSAYPAASMAESIRTKIDAGENSRCSYDKILTMEGNKQLPEKSFSLAELFKKTVKPLRNFSLRPYPLAAASALAMIIAVLLIMPGIREANYLRTDYEQGIRIKGLDSRLLLYRMKGTEIEELKNNETARAGDVIQIGYIAAGNYKHGVILSIDGRGTVTLHLPDSSRPEKEIVTNRRILLDKSYELDDSPSFERFILILSAGPLNTDDMIKKAKKLAISGKDAVNGLIDAGGDTVEFSLIIKKSVYGDQKK